MKYQDTFDYSNNKELLHNIDLQMKDKHRVRVLSLFRLDQTYFNLLHELDRKYVISVSKINEELTIISIADS